MAKNKTVASKAKTRKKASGGAPKTKKAKSSKVQSGYDAIARLAEHPIVSDLIAIGATAAVTAIAAGMSKKSGKTSGKAVKDAGKAAAAAIGARLMTEFQAVKDSAADAKAKAAKPNATKPKKA